MTLALLTSITNCFNTSIGHNWKLMATKNMANYGSGGVTKTRVPLRRGHTNTTESLRDWWCIKHINSMEQATSKYYVPHVLVLNKEMKTGKFSENIIATSKLRN
jgi:hypothetical protein